MRLQIARAGAAVMTLVVKRVKGKLYVYDEYRVNGKVHTFYIGPLEEMARVYQVYKSLGKVEKLSKRDIRRLAKILLEEYVKKLGVVNSKAVREMLEPPAGFEPATTGLQGRRQSWAGGGVSGHELTTMLGRPPVDNSLLEEFGRWLSGKVAPETARDYVGVVKRGLWPPERRAHVRAWRKYVHFLFSVGVLSWEREQQYLAFLKLPSVERKMEEEVPITVILRYKEALERAGLKQLYTMLLGGARLEHIVKALRTWRPEQVVKHPTKRFEQRLYCTESFCRYYLGEKHGKKRINYIYFPKLEPEELNLSYTRLKDLLSKRLKVQAKMFRKFANQRLETLAEQHNIRLDAVNLIMSRELSVTGEHYLDSRNRADKLFKIYVEWLQESGLLF